MAADRPADGAPPCAGPGPAAGADGPALDDPALAQALVAQRAVLVLAGPTASGKTELALALAERLPVRLVSVDSAQVYRGMDIGTAKPDAAVQARHPHALVDIRDPSEPYSAADFCRDADAAIGAALAAGRIPLLVGGTMLYFRALLDGLAELPPADPALRAELVARAEREGWADMHALLARCDPVSARRIHPNDPQRILRALEVHRLTGRTLDELWRAAATTGLAAADNRHRARVLSIALHEGERAQLQGRIAARFDAMLAAGLLEEVAALHARGDLHAALPSMRSVGYRQLWPVVAGGGPLAAARAAAIHATCQLARRQMTWLRSFAAGCATRADAPDRLDCALNYLRREAIVPAHQNRRSSAPTA